VLLILFSNDDSNALRSMEGDDVSAVGGDDWGGLLRNDMMNYRCSLLK
jgi:hypothetical protein